MEKKLSELVSMAADGLAGSWQLHMSVMGAQAAELVEIETTFKPDKLAIKHLLDAGKEVPGAQIKFGKPSLIIK